MNDAKVQTANIDGQIVFQVSGRANVRIAGDFRAYADELLDSDGASSIVVDLNDCETMDSTFMGVLAMIGLAAADKEIPALFANVSIDNRKLLDEIGVANVWAFVEKDLTTGEWQSMLPSTFEMNGQLVLDAHKTLIDLDERNIAEFQNVVDLLTQELKDTED